MTRPVVVDVARGVVACHTGIPPLGMVYANHLRRKLATYFPPPGSTVPDTHPVTPHGYHPQAAPPLPYPQPAPPYPQAAPPGQVPPPASHRYG